MYITTYKDDPTGIPDGYPRTARTLRDGEQPHADETEISDADYAALIESFAPAMAARDATIEEQKAIEAETYLIPKEDFFARLTPQQWGTIHALREQNVNVAYFWDLYNSLRLGVYGPPDGRTAERAKSQQAAMLLTAIFGERETARLLAKP